MEVRRFEIGSFMTNCYVATSDDGRAAALIDAPEEIERVIAYCDASGIVPTMLILTHGHVDHIGGCAAVKRRWAEIRLAVHGDDAAKLTSPIRNLSLLMGMNVKSPPADVLLKEGDRIELGDETLEVLHTPGHTPGGISLLARPKSGPPIVFTGDALFCEGIGRTDFPGASHRTLLGSIREKLLTLPNDTVCYPGHGPETTIGRERRGNPFLQED